jgi:hypothetical protein
MSNELFTDFQFGVYFRGTLGMGNWRTATSGESAVADGTVATSTPLERNATTFGWDFGPAARLMNRNRLGVTVYGGFSVRNLAGDAGHTGEAVRDENFCIREPGSTCDPGSSARLLQEAIFGESAADKPWWGGSVGLRASFADLTIDFQYLKLTDGGGVRTVSGLTGGQLLTTIEFRGGVRLPSGGNGSPEFNDTPEARLFVSGKLADDTEVERAAAGAPLALFTGSELSFDATESTSRHTITAYEWTVIGPNGVAVPDTDSVSGTYSFDLNDPGNYSVIMVIADAHGGVDRAEWTALVASPITPDEISFLHVYEDGTPVPNPLPPETQINVRPNSTVVTTVTVAGTQSPTAEVTWPPNADDSDAPACETVDSACRLRVSDSGEHEITASVAFLGHPAVTRSFTLRVSGPAPPSAETESIDTGGTSATPAAVPNTSPPNRDEDSPEKP